MDIRRIIREEVDELTWLDDIQELDALTDDEKRSGYTMFHALTGRLGFSESDAIQILAKHNQPRERFKHEYDSDTTYWIPSNASSTFQLKYPPKWNSLTRKFIDWIRWNPGGTKKEFYTEVLDREYTTGHQGQFWGSIKDSGITQTEKGRNGELKYSLGPNYEAWTSGKLKRYMGINTPWRYNGDK